MTPQPGVADSIDPADEKHLENVTIDAVLDWLLAHDPPLTAMAIGEDGLAVPMPPSVPMKPGKIVEGVGSVLELCLPGDLPDIVKAWERARRTGGAQVAVHLKVDPDLAVVLQFVDARHRFGVFLGFLVGNTGQIHGVVAEPSLFLPRTFTLARNELGVILEADEAAPKILGWSAAELIGKRTLDLIHPDDRPLAIANWMAMLARPTLHPRQVFRYQHRNGGYVWLESAHDNRLADPSIKRVVTLMVDVSDRMEATEALRANERLLRRLTEALPIGIVQIDADRRIVHANKRLGTIVGVAEATTIDEQFARVATADRQVLDAALRALLANGVADDIDLTVDVEEGPRRCSVSLRTLANEDDTVAGAIACVTDITEGYRMREELERRARFDDLTSCENRAAILETLESVLHATWPRTAGIALLYIDLNRFKETNDRFGHAAGDELLRRVAERLLHGARTGDVVGRLGGDEFLIICLNVATPQSALDIAVRTVAALAQRTVIASQTTVPKASIGVAWTDLPIDADTFVAHADAAMYESKRRAVGPVLFHAPPSEPNEKLMQSWTLRK